MTSGIGLRPGGEGEGVVIIGVWTGLTGVIEGDVEISSTWNDSGVRRVKSSSEKYVLS